MLKRYVFLLLMSLLLAQQTPVWSARMPRGSFLRQPAHSAAQLASQVQRDPIVASRYEKHFGVPAAQFASYVRSQLGLRHLQSGGSYRVFFVKKGGTMGSSVRRLRQGTAVFMHLRTNKPVLLAECGNPMGTSLPGYSAPASRSVTPFEPARTVITPTEQAPEASLPPPVHSPSPDVFEDPALVQTQAMEPVLWEADVALSAPDLPVSHISSVAYAAPATLTPLFMVGASGLVSLGGGAPGRGGSSPPSAVPEPTSLVLWVIAGGTLILVRRAKRV
ncbi:MAG: hypothetical protein KatS3mg022_0455 [Armatimonadota bacterium]|nr:MAG: hypothetical protein KatS3mg022_0455 [Armatimonadota bacterium]